ncbi:hypothetical protein RhiirC2_854749 [Rhizophagus irregularis]|uniref:F-box domain-containing protein n=1 Tax=Rhizophagus irregularis TaxID=588596 RepID=A0A2N1MQD7_9GLOM|nr:hypothetical protein RhiirC2_854749 [Rhizophagus irregularis]
MTCSKLFSGDLPELINEIIEYFHDDFKTLHSCILVNRLWCRLAIPLLWKDPFSILTENYNFIEIYLHYLKDDDKKKLNEYIIRNDLFSSNTLFNYPSFIQHLDTCKINYAINRWITTFETSTTETPNSGYFIQNTKKLLLSQTPNFTKLIYRLLFQIFIENEVNLNSFEIMLFNSTGFEYFDEILQLILQNPKFIYNIKNFKIDLDKETDSVTRFSNLLYSNCESISSLYFQFSSDDSDPDSDLDENDDIHPVTEKCLSLSQIIQSQKNLKKILIGYNFPLHQSLLSLKNPYCSNTLNTIIFYYVDFNNITVLTEVFNQLNVLESIHIIYCFSLDSKFIQQIINITKSFKLKSLLLNEIDDDDLLEPLIQKSGNYLENFGIVNNESGPLLQQLLQLIIKYCNKIKYLGRIRFSNENIHLIINLIENISQNLSYLTIDAFCLSYLENNLNDSIKISSIILQNLGQILPFKLEYLHLILNSIDENDLKIFLKNFQNTFVKKLLIKHKKNDDKCKSIYSYMEEFIMKKKRVKYFAFTETYFGGINDLFTCEDKVKKYESYDIQVLNYRDSFISNIYDFINEID